MARNKSQEFKKKLIKYISKNKRPPIWIVLKTKNREILRKRKRNWRYDKLKLVTKHTKLAEKYTKHKKIKNSIRDKKVK